MKNLGSEAIYNVTSTYELDAGATYTYTWNVTFAASMGDVPQLTVEPGDADLSSTGADITISTVQVFCPCASTRNSLLNTTERNGHACTDVQAR